MVDGGASHPVEEEGGALDLLTDEEAEGGEHGDATVGDLDVGVALRLRLLNVVEEAEGVDALWERGAPLHEPFAHRVLQAVELFAPAVTVVLLTLGRRDAEATVRSGARERAQTTVDMSAGGEVARWARARERGDVEATPEVPRGRRIAPGSSYRRVSRRPMLPERVSRA